jgi:integrase
MGHHNAEKKGESACSPCPARHVGREHPQGGLHLKEGEAWLLAEDLRGDACYVGRRVHPKLVQRFLGHASIAMTLDRYSHWIPSMGKHAADGMDEALG